MTLTRADLMSLEEYSSQRDMFRTRVIAHKKDRKVFLGPHATLYFEDALTMQYQVQEMLRIEKIFVAAEIEEELAAYNPLIPSGTNLKATFMLEYADAEERQRALATLGGVEDTVWVRIGDGDRVYAIANEDLDRTRDEKAAAVHFMRFEFTDADIVAAKAGAPIAMGVEHPALDYGIMLADHIAECLAGDFD